MCRGLNTPVVNYTIERRVSGDLDDVEAAVRDALADEGFGVLTEIDVGATFEQKLDIEDYRDYRILGACNPGLAHEALDAEVAIGALLPCNVVLYEADDREVVVCAVDAEAMLSIVDNPAVESIASEVRDRMERALDELAD